MTSINAVESIKADLDDLIEQMILRVRDHAKAGSGKVLVEWEETFRAVLARGGEWSEVQPKWNALSQFLPPTF